MVRWRGSCPLPGHATCKQCKHLPSSPRPSLTQSITLHTNLGDIKLELYCEEAPRTAQNFLALCASGYYDGVIFHRNIKGFMIQVRAVHCAQGVAAHRL